MSKRFALVLFLLLSTSAFGESVDLYIYHRQPPFLIGQPGQPAGLMREVEALLNRHAQGQTRFATRVRPRARLNKELAGWIAGRCAAGGEGCRDNWMLFWVTPAWGWGADAERRFLWSDLCHDEDLVISRQGHRVEYRDAQSLIGQRFAALRGHHYPQGVEELMRQGRIQREDGEDGLALLLRVRSRRAGVTVLQRSAYDYYLAHEAGLAEARREFYVAPTPFKRFTLQAMMPPGRSDLRDFLERVKRDPAWAELFARYGLQAL